RIAARMDKCVVIRSITGATDRHDAIQCLTAYLPRDQANIGGRPSIGAIVAKVKGPADPSVPPFVGLAARTQHVPWSDPGTAGWLGTAYAPFKPEGQGMEDLTLKGVGLENLPDRRKMMAAFDGLRRDLDTTGQVKGMDALTERALGVLTS